MVSEVGQQLARDEVVVFAELVRFEQSAYFAEFARPNMLAFLKSLVPAAAATNPA